MNFIEESALLWDIVEPTAFIITIYYLEKIDKDLQELIKILKDALERD